MTKNKGKRNNIHEHIHRKSPAIDSLLLQLKVKEINSSPPPTISNPLITCSISKKQDKFKLRKKTQ